MKAVAVLLIAITATACELPVNGTGPDNLLSETDAEAPKKPSLTSDAAAVVSSACTELNPQFASAGIALAVPKVCNNYGGGTQACVTATWYFRGATTAASDFYCGTYDAPAACTGCNYTCGCMLEHVKTCNWCGQDFPGAPILLRGCD